MSTVTCPGCNHAFTPGWSMYVHLYPLFHCHNTHVPLFDSHPFWLNPGSTHFNSMSTASDKCQFHSDDCFPDPDSESDEITMT